MLLLVLLVAIVLTSCTGCENIIFPCGLPVNVFLGAPYYGHHHTDETKRKMSEYRRGRRRPPRSAEWCEKLRVANTGKRLSDEHRRKISDANRGERNPMYGVHLTGDKNPNWQGGKSFEPYCSKFSDSLKIRVREKFGRRCYLCGKHESGNVQPLCVHHVDYNKNQGCGHSWSLVPLCHSCHSKTNHNRWYWFNLLSSHWASCWIGSFVGGSIDP